MKTCVYCAIEKDLSEFSKHTGHKDNKDTRCKECVRENARIRRKIAKTAPPKPEICDSCGKVPKHNKKIVLDHCHKKLVFRGWLCDQCNVGIGLLGDNLSGLETAVLYLKRVHET